MALLSFMGCCLTPSERRVTPNKMLHSAALDSAAFSFSPKTIDDTLLTDFAIIEML